MRKYLAGLLVLCLLAVPCFALEGTVTVGAPSALLMTPDGQVLFEKDVPFYATNPDLRCPIDFGFIPDCGAICDMITATTDKKPVYLGKPNKEVVRMCLLDSGFSEEETIVVGDRLYTDIACGINAGVDTCVLFTGEAKKEDMLDTPYKASYEFENVRTFLEAILGE